MAWPKGVSRKERDKQLADAKAQGVQAPPIAKSIAAPKVVSEITHPEVGMAVPRVEPVPQPEYKPAAQPATPQAPPPNLFFAGVKKLEVHGKNVGKPGYDPNHPIPGFVLYWFNDVMDGQVVSAAIGSGWEFVEKDEVALNPTQVSPGNCDLGNRVKRFVDRGEGNPTYAFLMKKPEWLHELHEAQREELHRRMEVQLLEGAQNNQIPLDKRHRPSVGGIRIETSVLQPKSR